MKSFPQDLIDAFNSDEVIGIVGSGPSVAVGFPSWDRLLELMIAECEKQLVGFKQAKELRNLLKRGHLLEVADECSRLLEGQLYRDLFQRVFRREDVQLGKLHGLIAKLPFSALLTTNYDNLLERAYVQQPREDAYPLVFTRRNAAQLPRLATERRFFLFKVHGDADDVESLVLSKRDYRDIIHSSEVYRTALSQILATHTALFIGYGLRDYDLNLVLGEQAALFKAYGRRHYAFLAEPGTVLPRSFLEHYNITVLPYRRGKGHHELEVLLDELVKRVKSPQRADKGAEARSIEQLLQVEREFCKRLGTFVEPERARFLKYHASARLQSADHELIERSIEYWDAREVTRTQLEAQLRQSQKMESVGQLAGGIAHDFNNILSAILMCVGMLRMRLKEGVSLKEEDTDIVEQIEHAATRASELVRQLLIFSRKRVFQAIPTDVNDVLNGVSKMLQRIIGEHITLKLMLAPNLPSVMADHGMIEQVIMNLAVNARDAMAAGGLLTIKTATSEATSENLSRNPEARVGRCVSISVADTGCGIAPENRPRIFDPFFTTKEVGKGTGLGLSTVYGILQQHNGWIEVRSEVGKGSEFEVFLPECASGQRVKKPTREAKGLHGHETILVVEDEPATRHLVACILRNFGYTVIEASDGPEALSLWEAHAKDVELLLTDVVMPGGMNGHELGQALMNRKPSLRVLYTSGYTIDLETNEEFAKSFLPKPFSPQTLLEMLRTVLERP